MLSHDYSYEEILQTSIKVAWTEREVLEGRDFDYSKRFLPNRLSETDGIRCLDGHEKLKLNQIMGNAYCHLFAYVEEYIIPQALEAAQRDIWGDEARLRTLLLFAEDESKHQALFQRSTELFERGFGVRCGLIPAREEVARVVLSKSRLCSYLLTSMIEWMTQMHYVEHVKDRRELDGLFRDLVRYHWMDEAQHAKIDSLLIDEIVREVSADDREKAVDELLELGGAVDGLLSQQADLDLASLEVAIGRTLSDADKDEIKRHTQRAYRWTFLVSGLEHPEFVQIVGELTERGTGKLEAVARALSA
ncbi:MAG TPA: hypothetical protein VMN82_12100 [Thermoanaerobaculia bacterium]|nr:hypothetical protein [Thermoanaerobaculia bacterium]